MRPKQILMFITCCLLVHAVYADEAGSLTTPGNAPAGPPAMVAEPQNETPAVSPIYVKRVKGDLNKIYQQVFTSLENNSYFIVFEPNIGKQLERFKQRWGNKYNVNKLESIRSMVFCNTWYANEVSNQDPTLLALCPMHITFTEKQGVVTILYIRPSQLAKGSAAEKLALEIEQDVVRSIEEGLGH